MLTPEQIEAMADESYKDYMDDKNDDWCIAFARAVEAAARAEVEPLVRQMLEALVMEGSARYEPQMAAEDAARAWLSPQVGDKGDVTQA